MKKLLIISLHPQGGCYHYSNEIIAQITSEKVVYLNGKTYEKHAITNFRTVKAYGFGTIARYLSLFFFLINIFIGGLSGKYKALLLMGFTAWDPFITRVFKLTGKPIFYVVHDGKVHLGETADFTQKRLLSAIKDSDYLIFLSEYVHNLVKQNFNIDKEFHIAPHGLIDYGNIPSGAKIKKQPPTLLFVGRLSKYKGIDILLEAIKEIPDNIYDKLIIAGKTIQDYKVNIDNPKVELINKWLTEDEIASLLNTSDILIFPYIEATQSGVATLAINYLLPSVVTNVGGFKEQFPENGALFIEPEAKSLTNAIIELSTNDSLYNSISNVLLESRDKYSWKAITESLETFINKHL